MSKGRGSSEYMFQAYPTSDSILIVGGGYMVRFCLSAHGRSNGVSDGPMGGAFLASATGRKRGALETCRSKRCSREKVNELFAEYRRREFFFFRP